MGDVIRLSPRVGRTGGESERDQEGTLLVSPSVTEGDETTTPARETKIDDLYGAEDAQSTALIKRARQLLSNIDQRAAAAHLAYTSEDEIGADQQTMLLRTDLLELFLCRSVFESLATVVVALHYSLHNQHGSPLNAKQLFTIRKVVQHVREDMFLSFEEALDLVDSLEESGMIVDPPEATALTDVFADDTSDQSVGRHDSSDQRSSQADG
jgi:hypothetical protein